MWQQYILQRWPSIYNNFFTMMGGNMVLLTAEVDEEIPALLKESESQLTNWFVDIREWNIDLVAKDRLAWVLISGIPPHAWTEDFFKSLIGKFGMLIRLDEPTRKRQRLDVGMVLIAAMSKDSITLVFRVKVNNGLFNIRLLEEALSVNI